MEPDEKEKISKITAYFTSIFSHELDMSNFSDRIRLQKIIYIFKRAGLDLGFKFGWHIRGPYSPKLADEGYVYKHSKDICIFSYELEDNEKRIIEKVKSISSFLENEENSELLASLLYLNFEFGYEGQDLFNELKKRKSRFSDDEIRTALEMWGQVSGEYLN